MIANPLMQAQVLVIGPALAAIAREALADVRLESALAVVAAAKAPR